MSEISKQTRVELIESVSNRYREGSRSDKTLILDEFVRITKYHRKHALRLLGGRKGSVADRPAKPRKRVYDEAVRQALIVLWEASDRICGKRLKPLIPLLIESLTRHGHLKLDGEVQSKLLQASASTIDRALAPVRSGSKARQRRRPPAVSGQIPVRTSGGWDDPLPGFMEIDLVAHCGGSMAGRFSHTLTLTDISSGWTECVALAVRDSSLVVQGLESLRNSMPFPLLGIDSDNGGEFINDGVLEFAKRHGLDFTRSRPYKKNDQAWVEQKNGSVVRRLVGYGRLSGLAAAESLSRLYSSSRLFVNFFQPSFKLLKKERVGARVRKTYSPPATPAARLLSSKHVDDSSKGRLRAVLASLDPLRLLDEIRTMQRHLTGLAAGEPDHTPPHRSADLERFLASLGTAWKEGEVRPTHRKKATGERTWRTRKDPFESVWPQVVEWLDVEPDVNAKELLSRLREAHTDEFTAGHLRTLQRRVRDWRAMAVRRLMFTEDADVGLRPEDVKQAPGDVVHKL